MAQKRQPRRARDHAAHRQHCHDLVNGAETLLDMWRVYRNVRFPPDLEPEAEALMREVFYSGISAMKEFLDRLGEPSVSLEAGTQQLQRLHEELVTYAKGLQ